MSLLILACIYQLCTLSTVKSCTTNQTNIVSIACYNEDETYFEAQGWELAIQAINDEPSFLPNITLHLQRFYTGGNRQKALLQALSITQQQKFNETHVLFPIVLGSSSSPALSNTAKYPYSYR